MSWIGLIMQLLELLMADRVDTKRLSDLLGEPVEKDDARWRIEPSSSWAGALSEVWLHFEDLPAGAGLITTVELRLAHPWRTAADVLKQALGTSATELPMPPATIIAGDADLVPPLRTFAYDVEQDGRTGVAMIGARILDDEPADEINVFEIVVRRYYD